MMKGDKIMNIFETKDFYLAALFVSYKFQLVGSEKKEESVYFKIDNNKPELFQKLINDFLNYKAMVNLNKLTKATSLLRRELDKHKILK